MAEKKISAVSLKQLFYGPVIEDPELSGAKLYALLHPSSGDSTFHEIENVHQDTWTYEEAEASVTSYKNQITGNTYREDREAGDVAINFTIGLYQYQEKKDLQGGDLVTGSGSEVVGWKRGSGAQDIKKALVAKTKDDVWIVLPKASIGARGADTDGAIGLAVAGTMMESDVSGVAPEYWFDDSEVKGSPGA